MSANPYAIGCELLELKEVERRAQQRLRIARLTLTDCERAAELATAARIRVESTLDAALNR